MTAQQKRSFWLRHLHNWHWISSALCLIAMLLFAITGFTLNHAVDIEAKVTRSQQQAQLPPALLQKLNAAQQQQKAPTSLPLEVKHWLEREHHIDVDGKAIEWSPEEIYIALPRPGGDAWLRFNLDNGEMEYEKTERGMVAYFNDLHKGRNTGKAWSWFIDIFAIACLIFCITGLFLLKMHAGNRSLTWPLLVMGLVFPLVLAIVFIH
ncbi:MAG: PepSY-associated TM helix domain-containing protein [Burkholderiales bacterium]|nr:PepSY-associated TM helix domain-containing protein [Burkholderiales bacterium]